MQRFARILRHLLPDGEAWWFVGTAKLLAQFVDGLASFFETVKTFVDDVYGDAFASTTRARDEWENEFGIIDVGLTDEQRSVQIDAAMRERGGQSPRYMQDALQAAGFDVYVHEWWESEFPFVPRDPRTHVTQPLIGTVQCTGHVLPDPPWPEQAKCRARGSGQSVCNGYLQNDPNYIVNDGLSRRPPPGVSGDQATWPFFLYVGAETFPDHAVVPEQRRIEFLRWVMKLRPLHCWVVLLIDYDASSGSYFTDDQGELQILGL